MFELHEIVATPDPVMELGVMFPQASPDGTVSVRMTVPAKWFSADTVIVEFAGVLALTGPGRVMDIVKSLNWNTATAEWIREPLVPVIVRV
jgi:hypothetical protein